MLLLSDQLLNLPINSLQVGGQVGTILRPIIDPNNLELPAFWCSGAVGNSELILHTNDIRELNQFGAVIDDEDKLTSTEDLVRLQKVIKLNFNLQRTLVVTNNGSKIGRIEEYVINTDEFLVQKIHVSQPFFKSILIGSRIIDRQQIIRVEGKKIVVQEAENKGSNRASAIAFTPPQGQI